MLSDFIGELLIILALTLANGFFAASEIALVSARPSRLEARAQSGSHGARQAIELSQNSERFLAAVQIGITLIGTFAAAFGGARMSAIIAIALEDAGMNASAADSLSLGLIVLLLTYISLVFGELAPKQFALQNPEGVAVFVAPVISVLASVSRPFIALLSLSVNTLLRLIGVRQMVGPLVTMEDILYAVREGSESGAVQQGAAVLIEQVFRLAERPVRAVMTPRREIIAVSIDQPMAEIADMFIAHNHSRLPVYEDTVDHIIGTLTARTFIRMQHEGSASMKENLMPVELALDSEQVDDVMSRLVKEGRQMAIVLDEYGQTSGLVTLEDLLEELVGEIRDEYDDEESSPIAERENGSWLVDGRMEFGRAREEIGLPELPGLNESGYSTVAGALLLLLDRIPTAGDRIEAEGFAFEVVDMDGPRIDKVMITRIPLPDESPTLEANVDTVQPPDDAII